MAVVKQQLRLFTQDNQAYCEPVVWWRDNEPFYISADLSDLVQGRPHAGWGTFTLSIEAASPSFSSFNDSFFSLHVIHESKQERVENHKHIYVGISHEWQHVWGDSEQSVDVRDEAMLTEVVRNTFLCYAELDVTPFGGRKSWF